MKKNINKLIETLAILKRDRTSLDHLELPKHVVKEVSDDLFTAKTSLSELIEKVIDELIRQGETENLVRLGYLSKL